MNPKTKFLTSLSIAVFFLLGLVGVLRMFDCSSEPKTRVLESKTDLTSLVKRMKSSLNSSSSSSSSSSKGCPKTAMLCHRNRLEEQTASKFLSTLSHDSLKFLLHGMLSNLEYKCETKRSFGTSGLGAYEVCMGANIQPKPSDCLVYSFGVSTDWSFDEEMSKFGCEVHSFDPSIEKEDHMHGNVTFHNVGLWGSDIVNSNGWKLERLSTIRKRLGHAERVIDILKVDVEGGEWPFLRDVIYEDKDQQLSTVKQLLMELHSPRYKLETVTKKDYYEMITYLTDLRRSEFQIFKNYHDGNCCAVFASLMPPEIPERCCEEVAMVNLRFL